MLCLGVVYPVGRDGRPPTHSASWVGPRTERETEIERQGEEKEVTCWSEG